MFMYVLNLKLKHNNNIVKTRVHKHEYIKLLQVKLYPIFCTRIFLQKPIASLKWPSQCPV